jgi:hypothetical protein
LLRGHFRGCCGGFFGRGGLLRRSFFGRGGCLCGGTA